VAFSGVVEDPEAPGKTWTEVGMNGGIKETELPERFDSNEYQVLLVAEKYQTGFDQPLLHTMYVDRKLTGLQAVQTLSRLNRTCAGKEDTFILDFRNKPEEIFKAFKPYYEDTPTEPLTDAQHLYRLYHQIETCPPSKRRSKPLVRYLPRRKKRCICGDEWHPDQADRLRNGTRKSAGRSRRCCEFPESLRLSQVILIRIAT
jgi:hypothetical protein